MNISAFNHFFGSQNKLYSLICHLFKSFISCLVFFISFEAYAINTASELRWAEQLRDNIVIGDPLDLPLAADSSPDSRSGENGSTFFTIYTPHTTSSSKGAIILMHGTGAHPDWNDIIHPLRTTLPDKGWTTLSIQLPLIFPDKKDAQSRIQVIESSAARINSAVNFLRSEKYDYIAIISHSFGTLMALNYLQINADKTSSEEKPVINSAVIIGTPSSGSSIPLNSPMMIKKLQIPLLDIYGSEDLDSVLRSATARKPAAKKAANKNFRQVSTIGANHFYQGLDDELVIYITNWLNKIRSKP